MAVITLTGPTCAGKSSLEAELQKLGVGGVVSHTTRAPRAGEVDGKSYHFVNNGQFGRLSHAGKFVETNRFGSASYATSVESLEAAQAENDHVAIVIEPAGAANIQSHCKHRGLVCVPIWIDCSPMTQARRWVDRLTSDMLVGKDAVGAYSERLALMLSDEIEWRREAWEHRLLYQFRLDSTVSTPAALAGFVMASSTFAD